MLEKVPYGRRPHYPHMKPVDVAIWERFIDRNPDAYEEVAYDVAVGTGLPVPPGTEENIARDLTVLGQRKIDVVGFTQGVVDIIEVKPRAGTSALGQAIGYALLYRTTEDELAHTRPVVITDIETPDIKFLALAQGVKLVIVGRAK